MKTLTKAELAGTAEGERGRKARSAKAPGGRAAGGKDRAGEKVRGSSGLTAYDATGVAGGTDPDFHQPDAHARRAGFPAQKLSIDDCWTSVGDIADAIVAGLLHRRGQTVH